MENLLLVLERDKEVLLIVLQLIFCLWFFFLWLYAKMVAIASLYIKSYDDKIKYLKTKKLYYPLWLYMHINQVGFRLILKGEIKE